MTLPAESSTSSPTTSAAQRNPRVSIFLATACGLGYLPKAPGTFGAVGGLIMTLILFLFYAKLPISQGAAVAVHEHSTNVDPYLVAQIVVGMVIALVGAWAAGSAARFWQTEDPQKVVIDEVSGQHLTLVLGCALPISRAIAPASQTSIGGLLAHNATLNWKYLLLGFILFRTFDIWKPFPVRQAEALPGGWGIMADDWVAGIYAALVLWGVRALGL
jgi:phosphatidylglycerophosphatase A